MDRRTYPGYIKGRIDEMDGIIIEVERTTMNRRTDITAATIAILAVCLFMAMVSGCEDKKGVAATDIGVTVVNLDTGEEFLPTSLTICTDLEIDDLEDGLIINYEEWDIPDTLTISTESGGDLVLSFEGDELKITGDADMNEAAQIFFTEVLKEIADEYIRSRIGNE